nr:HD domain-containing phosphohydrolase [Rhizobium sp. SG570]
MTRKYTAGRSSGLARDQTHVSAADPILPDHIWRMITGTPYAETATALTSVTAYCLKEGRERCHRVTADLINSLELPARRGRRCGEGRWQRVKAITSTSRKCFCRSSAASSGRYRKAPTTRTIGANAPGRIGTRYPYARQIRRVSALMVTFGRSLAMGEDAIRLLGLGGLVHDLGKTALSVDPLRKPGQLTVQELAIIRTHPERGYEIAAQIDDMPEAVLDICLYHQTF